MGIFNKADQHAIPASETTIIARGAKVEGIFHCQTRLHIDGEIMGRVFSDSIVTIGKNGKVNGEISSSRLIVNGYFELHFFFLAALMSTLIALLLLFAKIKASIHMLAFSSLTVFVTGLHLHHPDHFPLIVPFLIFMNGVIASSRLVMQAHTPKELIIGFLSGSIPQLLLLVVWL